MSEKNPHLDFQMIGYPSKVNFEILIAYAATQSLKKTQVVNESIRVFIRQKFSEREQKKLRDFYDKMSPEERKNPSKYWNSKK